LALATNAMAKASFYMAPTEVTTSLGAFGDEELIDNGDGTSQATQRIRWDARTISEGNPPFAGTIARSPSGTNTSAIWNPLGGGTRGTMYQNPHANGNGNIEGNALMISGPNGLINAHGNRGGRISLMNADGSVHNYVTGPAFGADPPATGSRDGNGVIVHDGVGSPGEIRGIGLIAGAGSGGASEIMGGQLMFFGRTGNTPCCNYDVDENGDLTGGPAGAGPGANNPPAFDISGVTGNYVYGVILDTDNDGVSSAGDTGWDVSDYDALADPPVGSSGLIVAGKYGAGKIWMAGRKNDPTTGLGVPIVASADPSDASATTLGVDGSGRNAASVTFLNQGRGAFGGFAWDVSGDGGLVVGEAGGTPATWTRQDDGSYSEVCLFGDCNTTAEVGKAIAVSANGKWVTGWTGTGGGNVTDEPAGAEGFLYHVPSDRMFDLTAMAIARGNIGPDDLMRGIDVNNAGWVGGDINAGGGADMRAMLFLPEPATIGLLAMGGLMMLRRRR